MIMKSRRAKVVFSYVPQNEDELKLEVDEMIEVLGEVEEGWWKGKLRGQVGVFPSNFVVEIVGDDAVSSDSKSHESSASDNDISGDNSLDGNKRQGSIKREESSELKPKPVKGVGFGDIFAGGIKPKLLPIDGSNDKSSKTNVPPKKPPPPAPANSEEPAPKLPPKPTREQAKVLFAYQAQNDDELTIKEGDIITILSKDIEDQGWWKGEVNGNVGVFPDNFVEILKPQDEANAVASKTNRPSEKPLVSSALTNQLKSVTSKLEASKIGSNKSLDETLPKTTTGTSNSTTTATTTSSPFMPSGPALPGKKPKVSPVVFQQQPHKKPQPEQTVNMMSAKPDVVPHETHNDKFVEKEMNNTTSSNGDNQFSNMESSVNKLTHLTANRAKGPPARRPPSTLFKDPSVENKENGEVMMNNSLSENKSQVHATGVTTTTNTSITNNNTSSNANNKEQEKTEKLAPWMLELRKAQAEKRKDNHKANDEVAIPSPKEVSKPLVSPTKSSPNRFSGDFTVKSIPTTPEVNETSSTNAVQLLKPIKPITSKPSLTTNIASVNTNANNNSNNTILNNSSSSSVTNTSMTTSSISTVTKTNASTNVTVNSGSSAGVQSLPVSAPTSVSLAKVSDGPSQSTLPTKEMQELKQELAIIKESMAVRDGMKLVTRKEYEELVKQVSELKELVEQQKQSYGSVIKDLINDVAEERKKLATLQIEIDRLRKLTTTV